MSSGARTSVNGKRDSVAKLLAESHFRVDPAIRRIVRLVLSDAEQESRQDEPIKLLEVNEDTIATGVQPVYFSAHAPSGIDYPSIIVEVRPEEYQEIEEGTLRLPNGWVAQTEYSRPGD